MHNYKLIRYPLHQDGEPTSAPHIRFDHLLLEMVDLVGQRWGYIHTDRFGLTGYSGGAQVSLNALAHETQPLTTPPSSHTASSTFTLIAYIPSASVRPAWRPLLIRHYLGRQVLQTFRSSSRNL